MIYLRDEKLGWGGDPVLSNGCVKGPSREDGNKMINSKFQERFEKIF